MARRESESFSPEEVELLISENKITVGITQEVFGVDREILSQIINSVNSFNDIPDEKTRILKKAAHLLGGISFSHLKKETKGQHWFGLFSFYGETDSIYQYKTRVRRKRSTIFWLALHLNSKVTIP